MRQFQINEAKREKLKLIMNISGASGSGKTFSALLIAKGLMDAEMPDATEAEKWKAIALIDTEHNRSLVYAGVEKHGFKFGSFTHIPFEPPHDPESYKSALFIAKGIPYVRVVITDSMTHAWKEILQEQQDRGGRYQDWKDIRPKEAAFWGEIFEQNSHHMITTTRAKQSYALEKSEMEKLEVKKLGLQPVQNDQLEYEYMVNFMADEKHNVWATKDNTPFFEGLGHFKITPEHGQKLHAWLDKGEDVQAKEKAECEAKVKEIQEAAQAQKEVATLVSDLEKKSGKKLEEMPNKFLDRAIELVQAKLNDLSNEAKAEQGPPPGNEEAGRKAFVWVKGREALEALCNASVVSAATLTDIEEELQKQYKSFTEEELEDGFRKVLSRTAKEGKEEELKEAAKTLKIANAGKKKAKTLLGDFGAYVFEG